MPKLRTHYDTLKVSRDAPLDAIQAAYRSLARQYHPDHSGNSPQNEAAMQSLNAAYEVLSNPLKRAEHDRWIEAELGGGPSIATAAPVDFEPSAPTVSPPSDDRSPPQSASSGFARSAFSAVLVLCYLVSAFSMLYVPGFRIVGAVLLLAGWLHYRHSHPQ